MADEKISAMTSATSMGNADVLPIVQSTANKKVTKALLLTAAAGQDIVLVGASGNFCYITDVGIDNYVSCDDNKVDIAAEHFQINAGVSLSSSFDMSTAGVVNFTIPLGASWRVTNSTISGFITLTASGGVITIASPSNPIISYYPGASGDWDTPVPQFVNEAIDRIAAVVAVLNGAPIP